jgi:hypothetical protein
MFGRDTNHCQQRQHTHHTQERQADKNGQHHLEKLFHEIPFKYNRYKSTLKKQATFHRKHKT